MTHSDFEFFAFCTLRDPTTANNWLGRLVSAADLDGSATVSLTLPAAATRSGRDEIYPMPAADVAALREEG